MSRRFENRRVLVTGGASGIGKATAERFAAEGARLVLGDIDEDGADKTAAELSAAHGVEVGVVRYDASKAESCRDLVAEAARELSGLDILLNIAGIMQWGRLGEYPDEAWERALSINLSSVFYLIKAAIPHLVESKGNIVNVASAGALTAVPYTVAYTVSKAGVVALTRSAAVELGRHNIRVNAVCPGGVMTPMHEKTMRSAGFDPSLLEEAAARHMPKLAGVVVAEPWEIAASIAYLASDEARFATGTILTIDGGQTTG